MSVILLNASQRSVRFVSPESAVILLILLCLKANCVRFVACSNPVISATDAFSVPSSVRSAIACCVRATPSASPSALRTAVLRFASGIQSASLATAFWTCPTRIKILSINKIKKSIDNLFMVIVSPILNLCCVPLNNSGDTIAQDMC